LIDHIRTRVTEKLGIRYPILQAGMIWASSYKLAVACAEADILGTIGSASMKPDFLREQIRKARAATKKRVAVNIPLLRKDATELLEITLEEGIDIVISSAGNPAVLGPRIKGRRRGLDPCGAEREARQESTGLRRGHRDRRGHGGGGTQRRRRDHDGRLIPQLVDALSIPVVAAGGLADGRGFLAAMALGAEGVSIGTRFAATPESSSHQNYKEAIVRAADKDTALFAKKIAPVRAILNPFVDRVREAESRCVSREELEEVYGRSASRRGILEGDLETGELEAGQSSGIVKEILPAAEVVRRFVEEYERGLERLSGMK
jgi:enoyl-[acyl-carrier protein] reductase II